MSSVVPIGTLYACLVFSPGSETSITDKQGIDNIDKRKIFHNNDYESICKSIHCPCGTIFFQGEVDITNPRIPVSLRATMNLILTTYYLQHLDKISRIIGAANATLPVERPIKILKERQKGHEQPATTPILNKKDMVKTLSTIVDDLHGYLGESKIPLAYVMRDEPAVTPEAGPNM